MKGYLLKVTVNNTGLEREVEIPHNLSFEELHDVLQIVFGFENEHLHEFQFGNTRIVPIYIDEDLDYMEEGDLMEQEAKLDEIFGKIKNISYTYDFGDCWDMEIEIKPTECAQSYPRLVSFVGGMLEEDCGGPYAIGRIELDPVDIDEINLILKETYC